MTDPWLFNFGPRAIPTEGRDEMMALAFGHGPKAYLRAVWRQRRGDQPARKPRSLSWPASCRTEKGFVIPVPMPSNISTLPARKAK